jgi:hypothetical protein
MTATYYGKIPRGLNTLKFSRKRGGERLFHAFEATGVAAGRRLRSDGGNRGIDGKVRNPKNAKNDRRRP